jgi:autotransporter-associated beta strand protein
MPLGAGLFSTPVQAATLTWDADGLAPVNGGSGSWDTFTNRWFDGTNYVPWDNSGASTAVFGGTPGVVVIPTNTDITADSLRFDSSYLLLNPTTSLQKIFANSGVWDTGANTVEVLPVMAGANGLTKSGTGTLIFHGVNTFTGAVNVNAGVLALGNTQFADIPTTSPVNIAAGATLSFNLNGGFYNDNFASLSGAGTVTLGSNFYGMQLTSPGSTVTLAGTGTDFSGSIVGAGGRLFLTGGNSNVGTVTKLSGVNTFDGRVDIGPFTKLQVAGGSALADTVPVTMSQPSTLELLGNETIGSIGSPAGTGSNASLIILNANNLTINSGTNFNMNFQGIISGTGKLIKTGAGIQQMAIGGNTSTYTGGTEVRGGILTASNDSKLGTGGGILLDGGTLSNLAQAGNVGTITNSRAVSIGTNGGGLQVITDSSTDRTNAFSGVVSGTGLLTKTGPATLALNNAGNTFSGGLTVKEGIVSTTANGGTPFGTGSITLSPGRLSVNVSSSAIANVVSNGAMDPNATVRYGAGSEILLNRGAATNVTLILGNDAALANSVLNRMPGGTLTILPTAGVTNLGNVGSLNGDKVIVKGGVPTVNGIVSPSIVSTSAAFNGTAGDFLGYDKDNGFVVATYSSTDLGTAGPTDVVKHTVADVNLANPTTVYALNINRSVTGAALTIGNGAGAAGLIINGGTNTSIAPASLTFNGSDATIYTQNASAGAISAPVTITGSGGLTKFGLGALTINSPWTYAGPTRIAGGSLNVTANNLLPATTDVILTGVRGTSFSGSVSATTTDTSLSNQSMLRLGAGVSQTIASLSSDNTFAVVDLGTGTLTLNQNVNTAFRGTFAGTGGTLVKSGSGTLVVNPFNGAAFATGTTSAHLTSTYSKLAVNGGVFEFSQFNALPATPASFDPTAITLDGGVLRNTAIPIFTSDISAVPAILTYASNRGVFLGPGGGTIDIQNNYALAIFQLNNAEVTGAPLFSGPGDLTKDGEGSLRLGIGNTNTGRFILHAGRVQAQQGGSLGAIPEVLRTDALVLDGGTLESNGSGLIEPTRGINVTARGGTMAGNWNVTSPISGSGKLTKINTSAGGAQTTLTLNDTTTTPGTFTGTLSIEAGILSVPSGSNTIGSGSSIFLNPKFPVIVNKTGGTGDSVFTNPITFGAGSTIDIRVDTASSGALVFNGKLSGGGNIYKSAGTGQAANGNGNGILTFGGAGNDYTGRTIIMTGTLNVASDGALGSTNGATFVVDNPNGGATPGTLAFSNVNYTVPEPVSVSGQGANGQGSLRSMAGDNSFSGPIALVGDTTIGVDTGTSLRLNGTAKGAYAVTKIGDGKLTLAGVGNTWGDTTLQTGAIDFASTHRIGKLALRTGTTATLTTGNKLLRTTSVDFNTPVFPDATLDLTDGRLIVDYAAGSSTPLAQVRDQIISAYNTAGAPHWVNPGITSSTAASTGGRGVGYAEASEILSPGTTTWLGEGNIDTSAILVRTTLLGDATLDGATDFLDLARLAQNYNSTVKGVSDSWWTRGDFNYDGNVDFLDLALLAQNYNTALPTAPIPGASAGFEADLARAFANVPEPGALGLMSAAALAALTRRRRRREA